MGVVPPEKRGMGSGARMMLTQTGFVISIALSIGLVSSVMDPSVLLAIFSGTQIGSGSIDMEPFIGALHIAFAVGVVASLLGAVVSASRGGKQVIEDETAVRGPVAA
jgi:hypothetical protein